MAAYIRAKVVTFRQFHLKRFARAIERYRATVRNKRYKPDCQFTQSQACHIVPPIAVQLTKVRSSPTADDYFHGTKELQENLDPFMHDFSSLREWRTGAAPLGKDLQYLLEKKWGVPVYSWYGKTHFLQPPLVAAHTPCNRDE